jgi:hypothetical protein
MAEDGDGEASGDDFSSSTGSTVGRRSLSRNRRSSSSSSGGDDSVSSGRSAAERDQEVDAARAALTAARLVIAAAEQRYAHAVQQRRQANEEEDGASARSERSSVSGEAAAQRDNDLIMVLPTLAAFLDSSSTAPVVALAYKADGVVTVVEHAMDVKAGRASFCGILGKILGESVVADRRRPPPDGHASQAAHLRHAVAQQQHDPLTRLLYAAATGDAKGGGGASPAAGDASGLARSLHAALVAADVLSSVAHPTGSWLTQDLVGTLSQDAALPTRIRLKLNKLAGRRPAAECSPGRRARAKTLSSARARGGRGAARGRPRVSRWGRASGNNGPSSRSRRT